MALMAFVGCNKFLPMKVYNYWFIVFVQQLSWGVFPDPFSDRVLAPNIVDVVCRVVLRIHSSGIWAEV